MLLIALSLLCLDICSCLVSGYYLQSNECPLWHVKRGDLCECGTTLNMISCEETIFVPLGFCMTWDNISQSAVVNRCPFSYQLSKNAVLCSKHKYTDEYVSIPSNVSGPKLNYITCKKYNRQGTRCRQCQDGYGPALFSDGFSCANCNKYTHLWIWTCFYNWLWYSHVSNSHPLSD